MPLCPTCSRAVADGLEHCPSDGTKLAPAPAWIGRVLGERYRLKSLLGEGGMGTVYLAEHVVLGKPFAVKVLREEYSRDEELVRRFQLEAIAASRIGQENIVDITDFGRTPEGSLYFVMEHLAGRSLLKAIQHFGPLRVSRAIPVLVQICKALAAAHARGIVHRDLKPENVILVPREDGSDLAKVLDFGISQVVGVREGERITRVGVVLGTPEYMAPEQIEGRRMDHRVDVYALGILAYEALTGSVPFHGSSPVAVLVKHQNEQPQPPTKRKPDLLLPDGLEALILSMMEKDPAKRPQTMQEVAQALAKHDGGIAPTRQPVLRIEQTPEPLRIEPLPTVPPAAAAPPLAPEPIVPERRSPSSQLGTQELAAVQRGRPGTWLAAVAALLVLSAGGVVVWREEPPAPSAPKPTQTVAPTAPKPNPLSIEPLAPLLTEKLRVALRSVPTGATVWLGRARIGVTPLEVELARGVRAEYRFTLAGHLAVKQVVPADAGAVEVRLARQPRRARRADDAVFRKVEDLKENPFQ